MKHIKLSVDEELPFAVIPDACDYDFATFVLGPELSDASAAERFRFDLSRDDSVVS